MSFHTSRRFLRIPHRLRSWFDPRRLPSAAACQLSAPLCGGGRGAGPRAAGVGQERRRRAADRCAGARAAPRAAAPRWERAFIRARPVQRGLRQQGGAGGGPRRGSRSGSGWGCCLLPGRGAWCDPIRAAGRSPRDGPCGIWVGVVVLVAPGSYRRHLQTGWAGLPSPRVRSVCAASPPRASAGRAAIRGVTTRFTSAVLKGHGNAG